MQPRPEYQILERIASNDPESPSGSRMATCMLDLVELMASRGGEVDIAKSFCALVARVVPCDLVVIERRASPGAPPTMIGAWPAAPEMWEESRRDSSVARDAYERRQPCVGSSFSSEHKAAFSIHPAYEMDAGSGQRGKNSSGPVSAMAAPLFDGDQMVGLLYVRSVRRGFRYDDLDLKILVSVATGAAFKLRSLDLDDDVRHASSLQRRMLPDACIEVAGYELEGYLQSCHEVGGDLYLCLPRPDGRHLLAVGDVAGKGVPAAFCMSAAASVLALLAETTSGLGELMMRMHRHLFESYGAEEYITFFVVELEPGTGRLLYCNAGHEAARWVHADGSIDCLDSTAPPIALVEIERFETAEIQLEIGDLVAIFSDGIPEATRDWERFLGSASLDEILQEHRSEPLPMIRQRIMDEVLDFVGPDGITDDTTLMLLRRTQ